MDVYVVVSETTPPPSPRPLSEQTEPNACAGCGKTGVPLSLRKTAEALPFCSEECNEAQYERSAAALDVASVRRHAASLAEHGYTVVQVYGERDVAEVRRTFEHTLFSHMPEYNKDPATGRVPVAPGERHPLLVRGGFGALGNPSSFHAPIMRRMRRDAHAVAVPIFRMLANVVDRTDRSDRWLEQLMDRARVLTPGASITAESWHRDRTPATKINKAMGAEVVQEDDLIYGGWLALDGPQRFSGVRGSHKEPRNDGDKRGFAPLSAEEKAKYGALRDQAGDDWYVQIPAGHMLIFQQEMIHEVVGGKYGSHLPPSYRLFTGWRLTRSTHSMIGVSARAINRFFDWQEVPSIKSDQHPPMYPDMPWSSTTASRTGLARWSATTFQPCLLQERVVSSGPAAGETHRLVPKEFYSLYECALKLAAQAAIQRLLDKYEEITSIPKDDIDLSQLIDDQEDQAEYDILAALVSHPPDQVLPEYRVLGPDRTFEGVITPEDLAPYMMPAYGLHDRAILMPRPLFGRRK
jgi:hypothetical protein